MEDFASKKRQESSVGRDTSIMFVLGLKVAFVPNGLQEMIKNSPTYI